MASNTAVQSPKGQLTAPEVSAFCAQISLILKAGISMQDGIAIMCEDTTDRDGREILQTISDRVELGEPLYQALAAGKKFPKYVVDMVEIGEASGRLDQVMDSLCDYYDRQESITQSIKSAVTYPLVMVFMMLLTISVLVIKVLPIFSQVFQQLGNEMSASAQGLLAFGTMLGNVAMIVLIVLVVAVAVMLLLRVTPGGRRWLSDFSGRFFLTRDISAKMASGRFASAMSLTMASGLDVDQSLEMVERLVDNRQITAKVAKCRELLDNGSSFADALVASEIFSGVNAKMVTVGIHSGATDQVMSRIADRYEDEVTGKISHILSILEPTLVAILSVIVGVILISVMLPLMGIMSSIG